MLSQSDIEEIFAGAKSPAGVDALLETMLDHGGEVPGYIATDFWRWVEIRGGGHVLRILVAPDYLAVGSPPFRLARTTPYGAQAAEDTSNAILPSRKIVREIQRAASPRIPFLDVKGPPFNVPLSQIATANATKLANDAAERAFSSRGISAGEGLTIGYKKAIVSGPGLDGSKVAVYGGIGTSLDPASGKAEVVQPYYTGHPSSYSDYSHGIVLVSRKAVLDGASVDLRMDVFGASDPAIVALVNDHHDGAGKLEQFDPIFPNAGPKSRARFGRTIAAPPSSPSSNSSSSSSSSSTKKPPAGSLSSPASSSSSSSSSSAGLLALGALAGALFWWWRL
jgi:hypothetical protein